MKNKAPYFFAIILIWVICFVLSSVVNDYNYMYVAIAATAFILVGSI